MYHEVLCTFVHTSLLLVLDPFLPEFLPGNSYWADLPGVAGVVEKRGLPLRPRLLPGHSPQSLGTLSKGSSMLELQEGQVVSLIQDR